MKKIMMLKVLAACFAVCAENGTQEIDPDWEALVADALGNNKTITIPAGETWVAYADDMQYVNQLITDSGKLRINGTLVLDNATEYKSPGTGTGMIIKRGASTLVLSRGDWRFAGTVDIQAGEIDQQDYYLTDGLEKTCVYVRSGATYRISKTVDLGQVEVHVSGTGVNGAGALIIDKGGSGTVTKLVLDDDALVTINKSGLALSSYDSVASRRPANKPAPVILNGHKLTIGGNAAVNGFYNTVFSGGGEVVFNAKSDGTSRVIELSGTTDLSGAEKVTVSAGTEIRYSGAVLPQTAELSCGGDLTFSCAGTVAGITNAFCNWTGPVKFPSGGYLIMQPGGAGRQVTVSGSVSGATGIQVGTESSPATGAVCLGFTDAFSGTTAAYVSGRCDVMLYASAFPGAETAFPGCTVLPILSSGDGGTLLWTAEGLLDFWKGRVDESNPELSVATDGLDDPASLVFESEDVKEAFPSGNVVWSAVGGSGAYTLKGPYDDSFPLNINLLSGGIRLTGEDQIVLGDVLVGGMSAADGGTLTLDGATDVVWGDQTVTVGTLASGGTGFGQVLVTNSVLRSTCREQGDAGLGALWVGRHSRGTLEIEAGGVVSNKMYVGGGGPAAHQGSGVGAVYQRGGICAPVLTASGYLSAAIGPKSYGYYQMDDGLFEPDVVTDATTTFSVGAYGNGIFIQRGGTVKLNKCAVLGVGVSNGGSGHYCIRGGTASVYWANIINGVNKARGVLTVDGPSAEFKSRNYVNACSTADTDHQATVNLNNGGVLETSHLRTDKDVKSYSTPHPLTVNFNGGVLRTRSTEEIFVMNGAANSHRRVSRVAVYEKGATIDCIANARSVMLPFEAAGAGGIASITLSEPVEGCIAPRVEIEGEGFAANAIADFDTVTRAVTNIYITGRGWGYSKDTTTVRLYDGGTLKKTFSADEFTVADNETGGFTKKGAYMLSLGNTNGWRKTTSVLEGTLKLLCDGAVPSNTVLTLNAGATLDLNGCAASFSGLEGTGGTVANGTLVLSGDWTVDASRLAAGAAAGPFDADIDVSGLRFRLTDESLLDHGTWRRVLFTVAEGRTITGVPVSETDEWRFGVNGRTLRLVSMKPRGTVLSIR